MTEEQRERLRELQQRRRDDDDRQEDQQQERREEQQQEQQEGTRPPAGRRPATPNYKAYAPDKKKYVYAQKHNLYLAEEGKEDKAVQLTKDGAEEYSFAGGGFGFGGTRPAADGDAGSPPAADRKTRPSVTWSPDSKTFYVTRTDTRGVKELFLVNSLANPRPTLEKYKYPMPGEDAVRKSELYVCDRRRRRLVRGQAEVEGRDGTPTSTGARPPDELRFIRRDRLQRQPRDLHARTSRPARRSA